MTALTDTSPGNTPSLSRFGAYLAAALIVAIWRPDPLLDATLFGVALFTGFMLSRAEAGAKRFRPVIMTGLVPAIGFVPMVLATA